MDFFSYLLVFLLVGLVSVFVFSRLGLGPILGYLSAGIIIGPFALGIIHEAEFLHQISELGLVFFLFLIGLELSPKRIWHLKRSVFALGPAQLLGAGAVITAVSTIWVGASIEALVIGFALALSSTAIGMQLLAEKNEVTSPEGQDALGILIFQDLAVIPFLAFLTSKSEFSLSAILQPLLAVSLVIAGGLFIIPRALRFLARAQRQELFVAAALLLVIGVAVIMRSVGLSMALGAFLGGALLANSEFRHELQTDIEPFKALFFGLFFISMGISLDLGFLSTVILPLVLASLSLLAIKTSANLIALYATGLSPRIQAARVSSLLAQGGEFAFVIFGIAAATGTFRKDVATFCIGVVGLSMALTPLWYNLSLQLLKYLSTSKKTKPAFSVVNENPEVVIAGYGRFGQIVHRVLRLHQIPVTILESNHEQVEFVKKYGNKVFYGDATRLDLLRTAGVQNSKLFVLAIDQPIASIRTAEILKHHFPKVRIFARARNREHSLKLMALGVPQQDIVREVLHSSLTLTEDILMHLGMSCTMTHQTIESFLKHDAEVLAGQSQYIENEEELIQFTKKSSDQLEKIFESDQAESPDAKISISQ